MKRLFSHKYIFRIILGLFAVQAGFLALIMPFGTPPDEKNNIEFIRFYADHSVSPIFNEQVPTWNLGDKTREIDYLYHYSMSWVTRLSPLSFEQDLYIIRLLSVVCAVATFIVFARIGRRLGFGEVVINVSTLLLINLAMVLMLAAAINNDPYIWLLVGLSGLLVVRLAQSWRLADALALSSMVVYGGLVKRTFLPLALMLGLFLLVGLIKNWPAFTRQLKKIRWREWVMLAAVLVGIGLCVERLGGNFVRYGTVDPSCQQVQGKEACSVFWASVRAEYLAKHQDAAMLPFYQFLPAWFNHSIANILDIQTQGWRHEAKPPEWLTILTIGVLLSGIVLWLLYERRAYKKDRIKSLLRSGFVVAGIYVFAYQFIVNLAQYQSVHVFGIALNGRYILPGIFLLAGPLVFYYGKLLPRKVAIIAAIVMILLLTINSGLYMMTQNPQLFGH